MIRYYLSDDSLSFERKTTGASGYDLHAYIGTSRTISPGRRWIVPTGLRLQIPIGIEAQVRPRSGLARDHGIVAVFGTIDADYRGEISVTLMNLGESEYIINPLDRIAQLVFSNVIVGYPNVLQNHGTPYRVWSIRDLDETTRGSSGFGSTGR